MREGETAALDFGAELKPQGHWVGWVVRQGLKGIVLYGTELVEGSQ